MKNHRWLPESARWLISNGKVESAHFYLTKCAKVNSREQFMADLKPEVQNFTQSDHFYADIDRNFHSDKAFMFYSPDSVQSNNCRK